MKSFQNLLYAPLQSWSLELSCAVESNYLGDRKGVGNDP